MKITNITNPKRFFEVIGECKGRVELLTGEGDRLNLKSKLCQYIAITQMFSDATIGDIDLVLSEPEDVNRLVEFLVRG